MCVCVCVYLALFTVQYNTIQSHGVSRWFMGPRLADKNNLTQSLWTTVSHFATKHHGIPISQTLHSTIFAFRVGNKGKTFTLGWPLLQPAPSWCKAFLPVQISSPSPLHHISSHRIGQALGSNRLWSRQHYILSQNYCFTVCFSLATRNIDSAVLSTANNQILFLKPLSFRLGRRLKFRRHPLLR